MTFIAIVIFFLLFNTPSTLSQVTSAELAVKIPVVAADVSITATELKTGTTTKTIAEITGDSTTTSANAATVAANEATAEVATTTAATNTSTIAEDTKTIAVDTTAAVVVITTVATDTTKDATNTKTIAVETAVANSLTTVALTSVVGTAIPTTEANKSFSDDATTTTPRCFSPYKFCLDGTRVCALVDNNTNNNSTNNINVFTVTASDINDILSAGPSADKNLLPVKCSWLCGLDDSCVGFNIYTEGVLALW
ncbi:hypothetical protein HELRODRAFT_183075 [Helobdella robusta]|uniref:Apple domain-containing protein n=1 Tax=Helobdella robusta TaxID=6412 RepID=T1FJ47_HELRO|nr:hypothetical protein HELRODRAFT_183075 [Helobdella robusta]ESN89870.1 hypothetical protein HELRODRAFT_183075 [Helobdella robusta]